MPSRALPSIDWKRIETFIGFGRLDAPVVFIGMEEGLKNASALLEDLMVRSAYAEPIMDMKRAHVGIAGTEHYFDPQRAPRQPTWRVMADLMLRYEGNPQPTGPERKHYRTTWLGRSGGDSLLMELLPYPHPKSRDWLYAPFGRFATRDKYERTLLPIRRRLLQETLRAAPRKLVVCYGKKHWLQYEMLFDDVAFRDDGPFRVGEGGASRIVLTTHFSGYGFNTDEQLERFADIALRVRPLLT